MLQEPPDRSVLVIVIDDAGFGELDVGLPYFQGVAKAYTPTLTALAAQSAVYVATSTPVCSSSRASMLTGLHPERHGIGNVFRRGDPELDPGILNVFGVMNGRRRTAALGKWHLSEDPEHPARMGAATYQTNLLNLTGQNAGQPMSYTNWRWDAGGAEALGEHRGVMRETTHHTEAVTAWAVREIESAKRDAAAAFVWVGYAAPHEPLHYPPGFSGPDDPREKTLAMLEHLDQQLAVLLSHVDTTFDVWIVADNGASIAASLYPQGQRKGSVGAGGVDVPLIVHGVGIEPGLRADLVNFVDFLPTWAQRYASGQAFVGQTLWNGASFNGSLGSATAQVLPVHRFTRSAKYGPNGAFAGPYDTHRAMARNAQYKLRVETDIGAPAEVSWWYRVDGLDNELPELSVPAHVRARLWKELAAY